MWRWLRENVWADVDLFPPARQRRKSGIGLLAGFGLAGAIAAWRSGAGLGSDAARTLWIVGAVLGLGTLTPGLGRYVFSVLMGAAGLAGFVVNHVLLGLIFVLVLTPSGLVLRLFGKDLLDRRGFGQRRKDAGAWRGHRPPPPNQQYHHLS